jgi:hypothetical protein
MEKFTYLYPKIWIKLNGSRGYGPTIKVTAWNRNAGPFGTHTTNERNGKAPLNNYVEFAIWIGEGQPMAHYVERMDSESDVQQFCRFPACWSHVPRATCNNPAASRRLR